MKKIRKLTKMCTELRSTGSQPACLCWLSKQHKSDIPLRLVLSLPGNSYENLKKKHSPTFFDKSQGANIETNTREAEEILEKIELDSAENTIFLDIKSLYTNVPLKQVFDIALREFVSSRNMQCYEDTAKHCYRSNALWVQWLAVYKVRWTSYKSFSCGHTDIFVDERVRTCSEERVSNPQRK